MITVTTLNILGLSAGIVGTIILAVSLGRFLKALRLAVTAHEIFITTYLRPGAVVQITGSDIHLKKGAKSAAVYTVIGIVLVSIGFLLQLLQYLPSELIGTFIQR